MATYVTRSDHECLESRIRSIHLELGQCKVETRLRNGSIRIHSILGADPVRNLEGLAKASRLFGKKAEDRGLIMYIHTWIKLWMKDYMMAWLPGDFTDDRRKACEEAAERLNGTMEISYFLVMKWLARELLLEDIVALGRGIVEAHILKGAARGIIGESVDFLYIDHHCRKEVDKGYIWEVAEGKYSAWHKSRALLVMSGGLHYPATMPDMELEDFEQEADLVRRLSRHVYEVPLPGGREKQEIMEPVRWYLAGAEYATGWHILATDSYADRIEDEPNGLTFLGRAAICFNKGDTSSFYDVVKQAIEDWKTYNWNGAYEVCSRIADEIQSSALFALAAEMQDVVESAEYSESDVSAKVDGTSDEFMTLAEDVAGSWGWKELAQKLETLDMGKNENGNGRVELMRLAREIGATRFGVRFQLYTICQLADKSPADRQSLREQVERLLWINHVQDNRWILLCLIKLLNSLVSQHKDIVDEVTLEMYRQRSYEKKFPERNLLA